MLSVRRTSQLAQVLLAMALLAGCSSETEEPGGEVEAESASPAADETVMLPEAAEWVFYHAGRKDIGLESTTTVEAMRLRHWRGSERKTIYDKVVDPDGKRPNQPQLDVTRDGKTIAVKLRYDAWLVDLPTGTASWLWQGDYGAYSRPCFSHDGKKIALLGFHYPEGAKAKGPAYVHEGDLSLFVIDRESGSPREMAAGRCRYTPTVVWSMDDSSVYCVDVQRRIMRIDGETGDVLILTDIEDAYRVYAATKDSLIYGKQIAWVRMRGSPGPREASFAVFKSRLDGSDEKLLRKSGSMTHFLPSYDAKYVFFSEEAGVGSGAVPWFLDVENEKWYKPAECGLSMLIPDPQGWNPVTPETWPDD